MDQTDYLPRERAIQFGVKQLTDYELLALILRTGHKGEDVLQCATTLLKELGGISYLATTTLTKLRQSQGVGSTKAVALLAAVELGRSVYQSQQRAAILQITQPEDCLSIFQTELQYYHQEVFLTVFLNAKNQMVNYQEVYRGGLHSITVHAREIFRAAIEQSACSIILVHNHPSGDPRPSESDIETTKHLAGVGELIGIPLLDHVIIAGVSCVSLKREALF